MRVARRRGAPLSGGGLRSPRGKPVAASGGGPAALFVATGRAAPNARSDALGPYSQEDWFKAQIGPKGGVWVGEGLDSQTCIRAVRSHGERVDPGVKGDRGDAVEGGKMRKVKLLSEVRKG